MAEPAAASPAAPAPAAAAPAAAEPAAPPKPPTETERFHAALEKGKQAAAAKKADAGVEGDAAPTEEPKDGDTPAAPAEGSTPDAAAPAEGEPAEEPKTARAKEWAAIKKKNETLAKREREADRKIREINEKAAQLVQIQERFAEMDRLFRESPKQFVEKLSGRPGGLRELFIAATEEEKRTPEEDRLRNIEKENEALKAKISKWENDGEEFTKRQEAERKQQELQAWHRENFTKLEGSVTELAKSGDYPNVAEILKRPRARAYVCNDVYGRILEKWDNGRGVERPISDVLSDVEAELAAEAGSATDTTAPSARANGAEPTAKPEARPKRTPPSLTNERASARASAGRELKGDERKKYFASLLRTRPD